MLLKPSYIKPLEEVHQQYLGSLKQDWILAELPKKLLRNLGARKGLTPKFSRIFLIFLCNFCIKFRAFLHDFLSISHKNSPKFLQKLILYVLRYHFKSGGDESA